MKQKETVTRLAPTKDTLSMLFSLCGNICAFPGCDHEVFDQDNTFIAQVCHIEAASEGGQRFNSQSDKEARRQYNNLLILCYRHHKVTDNTKIYTTEKMQEMKLTHEAQFRSQPKFPALEVIDQVYNEEIRKYLENISADTQKILITQESHGQMLKAIYDKQVAESSTAASQPDSYDAKISEIIKYRTKGQHLTAIALLETMRKDDFEKLNPYEKYRLLANLGLLKLDLLENESAAALFIEALAFQPDNPKAINFGVLGYVLKGEEELAEQWITKALELSPDAPGIYSSLVRLKSKLPINELLELIPEPVRQNSEVAYEIARACQDQNEYQDAIVWAQIALDQASDTHYEFRAILATMILHSIQQPYQVVTGQVSQDTKIKAKYIIELYTKAWEEIKGTALQKSRAWFLINRGIAKKYEEDLEGAYEDFVAACAIMEQSLAWKHLLIGAVETERYEKAWEVMEILKTKIPNVDHAELAILEGDIRWQIGEHHQAIAILEDYVGKELPENLQKHVFDFLIERYIAINDLHKAKALNEQFKAFSATPFAPAIFDGKMALAENNTEEALSKFDLAFHSMDSESREPEIRDLAKQYEKLGHLDKAIELNEKITNLEVYSSETSRLLDLYFKAGEQTKLLVACEQLITRYGPVSKLTELKSHIYENIHDLPAAIKTCNEHLEIYPDDQFIRARLALIHARAADTENVKTVIKDWRHLDKSLPLKLQYLIASLFKEIGDLDRFRSFSYETRRQFINEVKGHEGYIQLHAIESRDQERQPDPELVGIGTVVSLTQAAQQSTFSIEDREDLQRAKGELSPASAEANAFLGKRVGDQIVFESGVAVGEIVKIQTKHNYAIRESFKLIGSTFAGAGSFRSFEIGDTGDFKSDFKSLFDMIDRQAEHQQKIDDFLSDKQFPIAAIAQIKRTNLVKLWTQLVSIDEAGILCAVNVEEVKNALDNLKRKVPILLDVTALCTLSHIKAFPEIALLDNTKYVSQSTLLVFREIIQELQPSAEEGTLNFGKHKGKYTRNIITSEEVKDYINRLTALLEWIEQECQILPCSAGLALNAHEKEKIDKAFGESTVDSLLTAKEKQCLLYSEDAYLRAIALNDHQLSGVASFMILVSLKLQQKITIERYTELMTSLASLHYRGIPTESRILMEATRSSRYKPGWPLSFALEGLVSPLMTPQHTANVICRYFLAIYKDPMQLILDQDIKILRESLVIAVLKLMELHFDMRHATQVIKHRLAELTEPEDQDVATINTIIRKFVQCPGGSIG